MKGVHIEHEITTGKCFIDPHYLFFLNIEKYIWGKSRYNSKSKLLILFNFLINMMLFRPLIQIKDLINKIQPMLTDKQILSIGSLHSLSHQEFQRKFDLM